MVSLLLLLLSSYLLGSIPTAYLLGRWLRGIDLREHGSRNVGATNAFRVLGPIPGVVVLLIDIGKGILPVILLNYPFLNQLFAPLLTRQTTPLTIEWMKVLSGTAAICGHIWTIWLRFKGGKGIATTAGVFIGLAPWALALSAGIWILIVGITGYISLGSIIASISLPIFMALLKAPANFLALSLLAAILAIVNHRSNIRRLLQGYERRIFERGQAR